MKKYVIMFLFVVVLIGLTLSSVLTEDTIQIFIDSLKNIKITYFFILFGVLVLYFVLQGAYMKLILKSLKTKVSLLKCVYYSMVEFYFSGITPSSTAGQPMQLYFMTKDDIPMGNSYITLILNLIYFKIIILILALWVMIAHTSYVFGNGALYIFFFILGFLFDVALIVIGFLLLFHQPLIRKMLNVVINFGSKIPYVKKYVEKYDVDGILEKYANQIVYIKSHKKEVVITFFITFVQRLLFFSIAYLVYRGMGYTHLSYLDLLAIQVVVQITCEAFPLPGGTGISENLFKDLFVPLMGIGIAEVGMVFTRLFAYYIPLLITGITVIIYYIYITIKGKKELKENV